MARLTGRLDAGASSIAIVVSRFNQIVTDRLVALAKADPPDPEALLTLGLLLSLIHI